MAQKTKKERRVVAYVTGTRADFGLMSSVLHAVANHSKLQLDLYATGMHLLPLFGQTVKLVKKEFPRVRTLPATFRADTREGMATFIANFFPHVVRAFTRARPDIVLTLGDRAEMIAVALACVYLGIPSCQLHGGEKTSTVDEIIRHAITKLSHLHFPATNESAERIERMGEDPWRIHAVGAPGLDVIVNQPLPSRAVLFKSLGLDPKERMILVTQHPVSEEWKIAAKQMQETLEAVKTFHLPVVVIYPNADAGGREMIQEILRERKNPLFRIFENLPYSSFLALEREASVWAGNSSAAMIESSFFHTPIVNIGTRQLGRQRGNNVIDVGYHRKEIIRAMKKSLENKPYLAKLQKGTCPWGDGKTGPRVARILSSVAITPKLLAKQITYA